MGHIQKNVSQSEKWVTVRKGWHSQKNGSEFKTYVRVREMNTVRKMCHSQQNV